MTRNDDQSWTLIEQNEESHEVRRLTFAYYNSAPHTRDSRPWVAESMEVEPALHVTVGKTEVEVALRNIERLSMIHRRDDSPLIRFRLRDGEEATGTIIDYGLLFGRTEERRIWFGPLDQVDEIVFADVAANGP